LPEAYRPGTILGKLSEESSKLTGLSTDTVIVAGGGDGQAAGTGANALTPERAYFNLGTAVVWQVFTENVTERVRHFVQWAVALKAAIITNAV
jgi:sugar (pentulose or hexulose) kinase